MKTAHIPTDLMIPVLLLASILLLASKCNDKQETQPCVLTGRLVAGCNGTPLAGVDLALTQELNMFNKGGFLTEVTTDENGYFRFEYVPEWSGKLSINLSGTILEEIPAQKNLDVGDVYFSSTVNFIIKLQVNNSYTENDTLYYSNWSHPNPPGLTLKIAGPFESGVIDTAINVPYPKIFRYGFQPELNMTYYVNDPEDNTIYFPVYPCSNVFGEVTFVVD